MTEVRSGGALQVLATDSRAGRERLELLDRRGRAGIAPEIGHAAGEIVDRVRSGGDAALLEAVRRFDGFDAPSAAALRLGTPASGSAKELGGLARFPQRAGEDAGAPSVQKVGLRSALGAPASPPASSSVPPLGAPASPPASDSVPPLGAPASPPASGDIDPKVLAAIEEARAAIEAYHRAQPHGPGVQRLERDGVSIEERRLPIRRVGLYVPGGRFPYPSTVLMTAVPARLAGVEEIVVATPPQAYRDSPVLQYVLDLIGVDEVWGMGGAHGVAALAYGTESVRAVDLIAGPGNAWVAAAKQYVAGDVGVDRDAGPSEVVIVATDDAPASWVAADLLAQAEHDPLAVAVLVTDSPALADRVASEVDRQLARLPTRDTAGPALEAHGAAFVADDLDAAFALAERLAPEHLQLIGAAAEARADEIRHAGAVFVGAPSPVVFGDYVAGPSHVLPTGGSARFASGLGVEDFVRRSHTVRFSDQASKAWAGAAETLANTEGLAAHAAAARLRRGRAGGEVEP